MTNNFFAPNNSVFLESLKNTKIIMDQQESWKWPLLMGIASQQVVLQIHQDKNVCNEDTHDLEMKMVGLVWKIVHVLWKEYESEHKKSTDSFPSQHLLRDQSGLTLVHLFVNKEWKNRWHTSSSTNTQDSLICDLVKYHCEQEAAFDNVDQLLVLEVLKYVLQNGLSIAKNFSEIIKYTLETYDAHRKRRGQSESSYDEIKQMGETLFKVIQVVFQLCTHFQPDLLTRDQVKDLNQSAKDFLDVLLSQKWTTKKLSDITTQAVHAEKSIHSLNERCSCCCKIQ